MQQGPVYLVLADGSVFEGKAFGAPLSDIRFGEVVFTTGMTGWQETLTDPSYKGQILCQTFPAVGNYGFNSQDNDSGRGWPAAYVVREWCAHPSNFRCEETVDAWLKKQGIPGICCIDTRALTRRLRSGGTKNGALLAKLPASLNALLRELKSAKPLAGAVYAASRGTPQVIAPDSLSEHAAPHPAQVPVRRAGADGRTRRVVLYDYGVKNTIVRHLSQRGCEVMIVPCGTPAVQAASLNPDGFVLSNGPGDPAEYANLSATVRELVKLGKPLFGICLGHQLLAHAMGARTAKLPFGHRGANQPVIELASGKTFITSQNHDYTVLEESVPAGVGRVSWINANDGSVEGVEYPDFNCFSVQFYPESYTGPQDTENLFDRFAGSL